MTDRRLRRALGAVFAGGLLVASATGCGDDEPSSSEERDASSSDRTGGDAVAGSIDCDLLDTDAILGITGSELVEVQQKALFDGYNHTVQDREFAGSSAGCDVDLAYGEFGPPELGIGVYVLEEDFFEFFMTSAASKDGFAEVGDVGDTAFLYRSLSSRTDLVVESGDSVVVISFARGVEGPAPGTSELVALWEEVAPALA